MSENFITNIFVEQARNIKDLDIPLSKEVRQHLILTGKNGVGKTSLLLEINKYFSQFEKGYFHSVVNKKQYLLRIKENLSYPNIDAEHKILLERELEDTELGLSVFGYTNITFSNTDDNINRQYHAGKYLLAFFDSKRQVNLTIPQGIKKVELQQKYGLTDKANVNFIQYIVNLKADRSFASDDNELEVVAKIDAWFERLENRLKQLFDTENLELRFDRKNYNFEIVTDKSAPFSFDTLSDGYSAIISIVTELLLRMEAHETKAYDLEGVVLIDEIETHLHVDLQKKILPFLTDFFPRIQFIVTTHSPFVLSSLPNATICDLETRIVTTDLSAYSYDALLESYFKTDKYSKELKTKIEAFENLIKIPQKTAAQNHELRRLKDYFAHAPKYLSKELLAKLQQIKIMELNTQTR